MVDTARAVTGLILAGTADRHPQQNVIVPHGGGALPLLADRISAFVQPSPPRAARHLTRWLPAPRVLRPGRRSLCPPGSCPAQPRRPGQLACGDFPFTAARGVGVRIAAAAAAVPPEAASWQSRTSGNAVRLLPRMTLPRLPDRYVLLLRRPANGIR